MRISRTATILAAILVSMTGGSPLADVSVTPAQAAGQATTPNSTCVDVAVARSPVEVADTERLTAREGSGNPRARGPQRADCARWGASHGARVTRSWMPSQRGPATGTGLRDAVTSAQVNSGIKTGGDRDKFVGTYRLVTIEQKNEQGQWVPTPRSHSLGYILYSPTGHMAAQIMPRDRKKYAAGAPTPDEARAALQGYTAYFGTFIVNEAEKYVIHRREGQINPGGQVDAKRFYEFVGNRLILTLPMANAPAQQGNTHLIWERLPETQLTATGKLFVGFRRLAYTERTVEKTPAAGGGPSGQRATERDTSRTGYIIYTPAGHMAVQIVRPNRNKYAGQTPTPEEAKAALQTYTSYFGRFTVDETGKFVILTRTDI